MTSILADIHFELARLARQKPLPSLRTAELLRRFLPDEALKLLEGLDPAYQEEDLSVDTVRCAALLESGQLFELCTLLPFVAPGPRKTLLEGRLWISEGKLEEADAALSSLIPSANPEIEAEARSCRVRLRMGLRGQYSQVELDQELDELEELCARYKAGVSQSLVRMLRKIAPAVPILGEGFVFRSRAELEAHYSLGFEQDRDKIGDIPLVVHGAARRHINDPHRYVGAILALAATEWRSGSHEKAKKIAIYGLKIGERLYQSLPNLAVFVQELLLAEEKP